MERIIESAESLCKLAALELSPKQQREVAATQLMLARKFLDCLIDDSSVLCPLMAARHAKVMRELLGRDTYAAPRDTYEALRFSAAIRERVRDFIKNRAEAIPVHFATGYEKLWVESRVHNGAAVDLVAIFASIGPGLCHVHPDCALGSFSSTATCDEFSWLNLGFGLYGTTISDRYCELLNRVQIKFQREIVSIYARLFSPKACKLDCAAHIKIMCAFRNTRMMRRFSISAGECVMETRHCGNTRTITYDRVCL